MTHNQDMGYYQMEESEERMSNNRGCLPMNRTEMEERGWKQADFVIKNMGTKEAAFQQLLAIMGLTKPLAGEELKEQLSI